MSRRIAAAEPCTHDCELETFFKPYVFGTLQLHMSGIFLRIHLCIFVGLTNSFSVSYIQQRKSECSFPGTFYPLQYPLVIPHQHRTPPTRPSSRCRVPGSRHVGFRVIGPSLSSQPPEPLDAWYTIVTAATADCMPTSAMQSALHNSDGRDQAPTTEQVKASAQDG